MQSSPSAQGDASYDVVVSGLERAIPEVAAGLERVFGLDPASAQALIASVPVTVCRGVNEIRAQYFMRALRGIGACVELRFEGDGPEEPAALPPSAPANDVHPVAAPAPPSAASCRAPTLLMGSDPLAATINAVPAPQLSAAEPKPDAGARWGELVRETPKARPVSRPLTPQGDRPSRQDPASYGELSLPAPAGGLPLVSLSPVQQPVAPSRERVTPAQPAAARVPPPPPAAVKTVAIAPQRAIVKTAAVTPKEPTRNLAAEDDTEFWSELPELLTFPWRERGFIWFITIGLWALGANVLAALGKYVPFMGTSFVFMLNTSVLALCADYHRRCMWAVANAEGALEEAPELDPARILHTYMRSGLHLLAFMVVSQLPLALWLVNEMMSNGVDGGMGLVLSRRFWLLAALPSMYWPMAVATASLYNRFPGVWFVPVGLRAILRAPLEYACITLIGGVALLLPWLVCSVLGRAAGLPDVFFVALMGLPLAASHGIMGALTGLLMRVRPQLFDSSTE